MSLEPFIYLVLFFLVALFSVITQWLRRQIEATPAPEAERPGRATFPSERRIGPSKAFVPVPPGALPEGLKPSAVTTLGRMRRRQPARLGSLQEVRRGIILMTILDTCRGLERPLARGRTR